MSIFCIVDDKHVPVFRVLWVSAIPHYCGHENCNHEGHYEIRLEQGESVWGKQKERDEMLRRLEAWHEGRELEGEGENPHWEG